MKNFYLFGIGEKNPELESKIALLKKNNFNVIIGPSIEEDKYLTKNFAYYKLAKEKKIYSFMSDVGRIYIAANTNKSGIYSDVGTIFGPNFIPFCNDLYKKNIDTIIGKNGYFYIFNQFFYFTKNSEYFKFMLNIYKKINDIEISLEEWSILPEILYLALYDIKYLKKMSLLKKVFRIKTNKIVILDPKILSLDGEYKIMAKKGYGSGHNNKNPDRKENHLQVTQKKSKLYSLENKIFLTNSGIIPFFNLVTGKKRNVSLPLKKLKNYKKVIKLVQKDIKN